MVDTGKQMRLTHAKISGPISNRKGSTIGMHQETRKDLGTTEGEDDQITAGMLPPPPRCNRSQSQSQNRRDVKFEVGAITAERNLTNLNAQEEDNGITRDQENEAEGRRNDGNNNFLCHAQGAMNNNNQ